MHMWHHDISTEGGAAKNFGIVFSLWDFLFRTAFWPRDRAPSEIGYTGEQELPSNLLGQVAFPLSRKREQH
jgi:sterol desaturase/sphingolipid hydroxylase (fatty acid hydroxylase superfamily)